MPVTGNWLRGESGQVWPGSLAVQGTTQGTLARREGEGSPSQSGSSRGLRAGVRAEGGIQARWL